MKVTVKTFSEEVLEKRDYRDALEIFIDNKRVFSVSDGEPEDATLLRDFNACHSIPDLMKRAFDAGAAGETWEGQKLSSWRILTEVL